MSHQKSLQQIRAELRALASELVVLADSYEPNSQVSMGMETEFVLKAKTLVKTAQTTMDYGITLITSVVDTAAIQTLLSINALQSIPLDGSITLEQLSKATNADQGLLERLLRVLVGSNFIHQDPSGAYSHTPLSHGFGADGFAGGFFSFLYTAGVEVLIRFPEYLSEKRTPSGHYTEPGGLDNLTHNPTSWRYGSEGKTIFDIYASRPAQAIQFQRIMSSVASVNPFTGFYDFDRIAFPSDASRPVLVDIGGGHGVAITRVLAVHPKIYARQCVLQDLPFMLASARQGNPELPGEVVCQDQDYFAAQPVRGARAYHLRAVAHDLSDENLKRVLGAVVPVMERDSKVLIADNVIPERGTKGLSGLMDMMMLMIAGKERTEADFRRVCGEVGLKVDGIYRAEGERTYAMVEASLA